MTTEQKQERLDFLYQEAVNLFMSKTDIDAIEYLPQDMFDEYNSLYKEVNGECNKCGELSSECKCD